MSADEESLQEFVVKATVRTVGTVEERFGDLPAAIRFAKEKMDEPHDGKRFWLEIERDDRSGSPTQLFALDTYEGPHDVLPSPLRPASARIPGGPIIGFRCWRIRSSCTLTGQVIRLGKEDVPETRIESPIMVSRYMTSHWTSPQVMYKCEAHKSPDQNHGCGLYAYNRIKLAVGEMYFRDPNDFKNPGDITVVGVVSGHGDVQVHREGFRAEEMHILGLVDSGPFPEARQKLSREFDVPLVNPENILRFAQCRGRIISKFDVDPRPLPRFLRKAKRAFGLPQGPEL